MQTPRPPSFLFFLSTFFAVGLLAGGCATSDLDDIVDDTEFEQRPQGKEDAFGLWPNVGMEKLGSGRDLTDGDDCHTERTVRWDCRRGDGKISFSACPSQGATISKPLYNALDSWGGTCIERAVKAAGDSTDFKRAHIFSGGGIINDRLTASGKYRSLHSWGRAVDIGDVEITFDDDSRKRYRYSRFSNENSSDHKFYDRLRDCWGNAVWGWLINTGADLVADNPLGTLSCDDAVGHCDHMHVSLSSNWLALRCSAPLE